MKVLVTGAAGFIGSHVVDALVSRGVEVVAIDDLSGGYRDNVNPSARFIQMSVVDHASIDALVSLEAFDYVFHLAAYAAEGLSHFIKRFNYTNNLIGSVNLINASVNAGTVKCFIFTSSIAVYGSAQVPMTEATIPEPEDPYGIAKYAVERDLREALEMFGLNHVIFRPHNVYGERQNIADRFRNVIGIFMNQALKEEPFTIFGDGGQTRAFSHVDDVAPVIASVPWHPESFNQVFNVGADTPYSVNHIAAAVAGAMGVSLQINHLAARNEVVHAFADHSRARGYFDREFRDLSLDEGIARMAAWVRRHGPRETPHFTDIEVPRNLPPFWEAWV